MPRNIGDRQPADKVVKSGGEALAPALSRNADFIDITISSFSEHTFFMLPQAREARGTVLHCWGGVPSYSRALPLFGALSHLFQVSSQVDVILASDPLVHTHSFLPKPQLNGLPTQQVQLSKYSRILDSGLAGQEEKVWEGLRLRES